jgi:hypothetical protein
MSQTARGNIKFLSNYNCTHMAIMQATTTAQLHAARAPLHAASRQLTGNGFRVLIKIISVDGCFPFG